MTKIYTVIEYDTDSDKYEVMNDLCELVNMENGGWDEEQETWLQLSDLPHETQNKIDISDAIISDTMKLLNTDKGYIIAGFFNLLKGKNV